MGDIIVKKYGERSVETNEKITKIEKRLINSTNLHF